jgi:hypothetical protein
MVNAKDVDRLRVVVDVENDPMRVVMELPQFNGKVLLLWNHPKLAGHVG